MSQIVTPRPTKRTAEEIAAELRRLRAQLRADNPELADEEWDALAERLGNEAKATLSEHVRLSRPPLD